MSKSVGLSLCALVILFTLPLFACNGPVTLTTSSTPPNGGTVSPAGGTYKKGVEVTLVATSASYYEFKGWAGEASGTSNPVKITMDSNRTVVARFEKKVYSVQLGVDSPGSGTMDPRSGNYEAGSQMKITATPASGFRFDRWGGSATGKTNPISVLVDGNKTITAYFIRQYSLRVSSSPIEAGTVTPGSGVYDAGTINLSATPAFPYAFKNWVGADNNSINPTNVTMNADKSVSVTFVKLTPIKTGQKNDGGNKYSGANVPIDLNQFEWVEGTINCGTFPQVHAYIKGPDNTNIKDFGSLGQANFRIMAPISGTYRVIIEPNGVYGAIWNITWTVYGLP